MAIFGNTGLPDDFFRQVDRHMRGRHRTDSEAVPDAVLAVLGRPLSAAERSAIVTAAQAGTLVHSLYPVQAAAEPLVESGRP